MLFALLIASNVYAQLPAPTLIAPPNHATNVDLYPLFDWYDVPGATSYQIQVFQGVNVILDQSGITISQYQVVSNVLQNNTYYYWRVRAMNSTQTSPWSSQWDFTTIVAGLPAPTLISPANNSINISLTTILDWSDVTGAVSYRVQVATDSLFNSLVLNIPGLGGSQYSVQTGQINPGTKYWWRARASNGTVEGSYSEIWNFTTVPPIPSPPVLISPANGATNVTVPLTMTWNTSSGATSYNLQVSTSSIFSSVVIDESGLTSTSYIATSAQLLGNTQYFWRVSATNASGTSAWSTVWNYTTGLAIPIAPLLIAPLNNSTGVSLFPLLDWNNVNGATSYAVQVSTDSNFTTLIINQSGFSASQYQVSSANNLQYNTLYYWRARAGNSAGYGPWSTKWHFTTTVAPPPAPTLIAPSNGATNVSLTPYFDWSDVSSALSYRIQVATSNTFNTTVIDLQVNPSNYTPPPGVLSGYTQYYWRVASINNGGTGPWSSAWNFTTMQTMYLNLKVFLEGFYNAGTQVQDTVTVYLAQSNSPYTFRDTAKIYLSSSGTGNISFGRAANGTYYIVIRHRNHLETWSKLPLQFTTGLTVSYDFTTAASKAYGDNMKQVGSVWVFWGGDINQDGAVNGFDYNAYIPQFGLNGYFNSDLDGNNYVEGADLLILYPNFGKSTLRPN
jgi:hypothetical protein